MLWQKNNRILQIGLAIVMLITIINKKGYEYFWTRMEFENSKLALAYMNEHHQEKEYIFVHFDAVPAFRFYNSMHDNAYNFEQVFLGKWADKPAAVRDKIEKGNNDFWIFFAHSFPKDKDATLKSAETIAMQIQDYQSSCTFASTYKFRFRE